MDSRPLVPSGSDPMAGLLWGQNRAWCPPSVACSRLAFESKFKYSPYLEAPGNEVGAPLSSGRREWEKRSLSSRLWGGVSALEALATWSRGQRWLRTVRSSWRGAQGLERPWGSSDWGRGSGSCLLRRRPEPARPRRCRRVCEAEESVQEYQECPFTGSV